MINYPKLNTTPIKEIIFTVSYTDNIDPVKLRTFCELSEIAESFTKQEAYKANIVSKSQETPLSKNRADGFVLRSESLDYVIQARVGSFAFHKIKEYESFESLFEKLNKFWIMFIKCTGQLTVQNISLRYVNFIEQEESERTEQLINVLVNHPFRFKLNSQLLRLNFVSDENPDLKINVVTAKAKDQDKTGIVLDTILNLDVTHSTDYEALMNNFYSMRDIKNEIFFNSLTEYAKQKYNGN